MFVASLCGFHSQRGLCEHYRRRLQSENDQTRRENSTFTDLGYRFVCDTVSVVMAGKIFVPCNIHTHVVY